MSQLRLAIVTRRFWPHCGSVETGVGELAAALNRAGHHIEILTIRWQKNWSRHFDFREVEVTRMGRPLNGPFGTFRYLRNMTRHVKDANFDGMLVFGMRDDSWAAIRSFVKSMPVIVRIDHHDIVSLGQHSLSHRQLVALNCVKKIFVDAESTARQLLAGNEIDPNLISIVPNAVEVDRNYRRSTAQQNAMRISLSDAHPILQIEPNQPLAICGSPLYGDGGMFDLVDAWRLVVDQHPQARLWILGDGSKGRFVWERIVDKGLADSIIMPGYFDSLPEIFQAANLYIHPMQSSVNCGCLVRALAAGTCTVATENDAVKNLIDKNVNGLLSPISNPPALAEAINLAFNRKELRDRLGRAARKIACTQFNVDQLATTYLEPFLGTESAETCSLK